MLAIYLQSTTNVVRVESKEIFFQ